jgi:peptide/nickel transport system substrate-binding protein
MYEKRQSRFDSGETYRRQLNRRTFLRVAAGSSLAAFLAACGGGEGDTGDQTSTSTGDAGRTVRQGGTLNVALPNEPEFQSLDAGRTTGTWTHQTALQIFDTVVVEDKDKNLKPGGLTTSWEEAPDGLSVTLKLKQGVTFHDGTQFNAEHIRFWLARISDPDNNRALAFSYLGPNYDSTEVIDNLTAKIKLKAPNQTMLRRFTRAYFGMPSMAAVEKLGLDNFARSPVGSGPFSLKEWVSKDRLTMPKNPAYNWGPEIFGHQGPPYLDTLVFRVIPDQETRANALESGDVQGIDEVPPVHVDRFSKDRNYKVVIGEPQGLTWMILLNTRLAPTNDPLVRKALNHAINKEEIIKTVYFSVHTPAYSPLSASSFGHNPELKDMYPHDLNRARQLLDQAGWTMGPSGVRQKGGQDLALSYVSTFKDVGEIVQNQLRPLGVRINLELIPTGTPGNQRVLEHRDHMDDGGTQQAGFLNEDSDIMRSTMHPQYDGAQTYATFIGYKDDQLTSMLERQQQLPRNEERRKLLQDIQRYMMDQALMVPVFNGRKAFVTAKNVDGVVIMPVNFYAFFYDAHFV